MSRSLIWKTCVLVFCGGVVGATGMHLSKPPKAAVRVDRGLASVQGVVKAPLLMGKHLSVVQVALQAPDGIPEREDQEVTLVGWVRLNRAAMADVTFRWELPAGVHVVEGSVEDSLTGLQSGETAQVRITLTGFSHEDLKIIALHGFIGSGEHLLGNSAVLTSRPQDSIEMLTSSTAEKATVNRKTVLNDRIIQ